MLWELFRTRFIGAGTGTIGPLKFCVLEFISAGTRTICPFKFCVLESISAGTGSIYSLKFCILLACFSLLHWVYHTVDQLTSRVVQWFPFQRQSIPNGLSCNVQSNLTTMRFTDSASQYSSTTKTEYIKSSTKVVLREGWCLIRGLFTVFDQGFIYTAGKHITVEVSKRCS